MGASVVERVELRPQPGPQEAFLATSADIAIIGGGAGGGKTWVLTAEPLRHIDVPGFTFAGFRRTRPDLVTPGGWWDEQYDLYPQFEGKPNEQELSWTFPSGAWGKVGGLQYDKDALGWKSAQVALLLFDQLEEFSEYQFFYLLSRNRSTCGVDPYVRATCNPDPDSWLRLFLDWWIDDETGYAIPERSGQVRWVIREGDTLVWADDPSEFAATHGAVRAGEAKSVTFILARLQDNVIRNEKDPSYLSSLKLLPLVEQERLLGGDRGGNWKIKAAGGLVFNRAWFEIIPAAPAIVSRRVRAWDKAATAGGGDWTVGLRMSVRDGTYYIEDIVRGQWGPDERERIIKQTAQLDGVGTAIRLEQEPGSSGVTDVRATIKNLAGFTVRAKPSTGSKVVRSGPVSAQVQARNVKLVAGHWNESFLRETDAFPTPGVPDDQVDPLSAAFEELTSGTSYDPKSWKTYRA